MVRAKRRARGMAFSAPAFLCAAFCLTVLLPTRALADDRPTPGSDVEGPPPLPGLSHRGIAVDTEYTLASAEPTDVTSRETITAGRAYSYAARVAVEWAVAPRRFFVGAASELGAARVPAGTTPASGGVAAVFGNPEIWARALWTSRVGLAAGGGLGLVLPLPRAFDSAELEAVRASRVVRPWALPLFDDLSLTVRPFVDLRHVTGPVVLQVRQGLDVAFRIRDPEASENRIDMTALVSVYAGVRVAQPVTLGLEFHEVYSLTEEVTAPSCAPPCDRYRIQLTLAPSVRLQFRVVTPTLSLLLPISTPLRADVASYYAARLHLGARFTLP